MIIRHIAKVAVDGANLNFDSLYDYLIPDFMLSQLKVGYRVLVPFGQGSKKRQGFVFAVMQQCDDQNRKKITYKSIYAICDKEPLLTQKALQLAEWLAERTFCTRFEAARALLPAGLCMEGKQTYALSPHCDVQSVCNSLTQEESDIIRLLAASKKFLPAELIGKKTDVADPIAVLKRLIKNNFVMTNWEPFSGANGKTLRTANLNVAEDDEEAFVGLTAKQRAVAQTLREIGSATVSELCYFTGVTASVVLALEKRGLITLTEEPQRRAPPQYRENGSRTEIVLTERQQDCYRNLREDLFAGEAACSLLFGVTGSGKTSVYLRLIDDAVDAKKNIILMVPEISLTPQTLSLFYARYGNKVAVFHSGLSAGERADEWRRVKNGEASIAIGTRSAVFAPFDTVGLIVIDEEQEHTYKSDRTPRYHAVDVAKYLCSRDKALLLLVSATPSVESYTHAKNGRYRLLTLSERFGNTALPQVETVDMSRKERADITSLSPQLLAYIDENLQNNRQSILLMNRRGYHTFVACSSCKTAVSCPSCSISLTYHKTNNRLMCHYCGYSAPLAETCPHCGGETIRYSGSGTQRIEEELRQLYPAARILRMDADTTMTKNAHEKKLREFSLHQYDILIGTQMVAKGLDFSDVSLVGVISADMGLYKDDYRSNERAFDLLTQVIGRAGRRKEQGKALIQTIAPDNEIILFAAEQNYSAFYDAEIENRKAMIYPPFCDICLIGFVSEKDIPTKAAAFFFLNMLKAACESAYRHQKIIVIGPNPSAIHKMGNKYRYKLLIKCRNSADFRAMIRCLLCDFMRDNRYKSVKIFADMNPESVF